MSSHNVAVVLIIIVGILLQVLGYMQKYSINLIVLKPVWICRIGMIIVILGVYLAL